MPKIKVLSNFAIIMLINVKMPTIASFLAHLSRSDKVSFCDRSSSVVRPLTIDLNDMSF